MAWALLAIIAAAFQTLGVLLQKKLSLGALSAAGATYARFFYSVSRLNGFVYSTGWARQRLRKQMRSPCQANAI